MLKIQETPDRGFEATAGCGLFFYKILSVFSLILERDGPVLDALLASTLTVF